ncbi:MAG: RNA polymerase sigma factor [Cyanothece sp. SIO2G6]|nr:RNA polymerase sigma factor [Cyanothece sp. SIO2G6]
MSDPVSTSTSNLSEQQLLQSIQSGNLSAFWSLWLMYQPYLFSRCFHWTGGNRSDAEDILSLAMCRAWEQMPRYAASLKNPKAWLIKLTHNLCVNQQLKRGRQAISLGDMEHAISDSNTISPITSSLESPESVLLKGEIRNYLNQLIKALEPRLRSPLLLYYFQGLDCAAIAQQERISVATVYKRLQLARDILRPQIQQYLAGHCHLHTIPSSTNVETEQDWLAPVPQSVPHVHEQIDDTIIATCLISLRPGSSR